MTLEFAILGFLNYRPHSGYDLKKHFDHTINHFWNAEQSQIYRTLNSLAESGLVKMEVVDQTDRPDRKVYHITDSGRQAFRKWLADPIPGQKARIASLVQIFFAGQLSNRELLEKFESTAAAVHQQLEAFQQLPAVEFAYLEGITSPREAYFWMATYKLGLRSLVSNIAWMEEIIDDLKNKNIPAE